MRKFITIVFIIVMFSSSSSLFASSASCSAQNMSTGQSFTASGDGATQVDASQNAENTVMQICKQGSNGTPETCVLEGCTSF